MGRGSAVIKTLVFLTFSLHLSSAVTHTLQYVNTAVTPGINFPEFTSVGQVDGQEFVYYDSKISKVIARTEWIQKVTDDDPQYWNRNTQILQSLQEIFKVDMAIAMQRFNQTKGVHTFQRMYGCELDDDGTTRGYSQFGYDGEDFMTFDLKTLTWTAPTPQALITKNKWDPDTGYNKGTEDYLKNECIEWLMKYLTYGRETQRRKDRPEVSVFQKHSSSPEVVCHATGFFPKTVMINWQKDGEDVREDVDLRETLHNQDGSFQIRSILRVPAEALQKHKYTCVVQHITGEIRKDVPKGGGSIGVIIAVVAALVALAVIGVIAGIVVWKKKNSGFKPVPPKPSSEGDSSSNNS
ncbi:H-2 class I histocompatibility antigen, Q9 alpha chain-like [Clarias gariepinus]|uniref:H-2 class I histocompatibility antigen, Q9 alpha chain-like n=1 Tax=Clarias gariepinus TaxID=13013 RepID=UPI00234CA596|nr:H-2 class I histocompatibility antigen, Q9 alpha chain-like [Clarias gariepinus]